MSDILLDYFFPVSSIDPIPQASTAFLRQVVVAVKPKVGVETGVAVLCTSQSQVALLTDNLDVQQLFNGGMNRVYVLPVDDLDLSEVLNSAESEYYTLLISSDFNDAEILGAGDVVVSEAVKAQVKIEDILFRAKVAGVEGNDIEVIYLDELTDGTALVDSVVGDVITVHIESGVTTAADIAQAILDDAGADALVEAIVDFGDGARAQLAQAGATLAGGVDEVTTPATQGLDVGTYKGVVGLYSNTKSVVRAEAIKAKRCGFYGTVGTAAKNLFFAFGKLLSNQLDWTNQQYIQMPFADDVDTIGEAEELFDDRVSFVLSSAQFGQRLGLFCAGGKAIVAPYILKNLEIDIQSAALTYISANQPQYTITQATLLEDELSKVIDSYIERRLIEQGSIEIRLEQNNFVASARITVSDPTAFWRVFGEVRQA